MLAATKAIGRVMFAPPSADAVTDPDPTLLDLAVPPLRLLRSYFRAEVIGLDHIPAGGALLVGNHNAGITFIEPFLLGLEWHLRHGSRDAIYGLGHDIMVGLPLVGNLLRGLGVIRAGHITAEAALAQNRKLMVFPGGNFEAFRPWRERHRVDFGGHAGYIRLALRTGVPIVPVLSIGGHETFVVLRRGQRLARALGVKKYLRSDSFPVFLGLPWGIGVGPMFHLPLPAKSLIEVGAAMHFSEYGPADADDRTLCRELSRRVEARLQEMMDAQAEQRRFPLLG
jgi:1-acyl-sn-glycerol-3-phosphate acyltransferase